MEESNGIDAAPSLGAATCQARRGLILLATSLGVLIA